MEEYVVGETLYSLNLKYKDGTRLRARAAEDSPFNGVWLPNDTPVRVLDFVPGFVNVQKQDDSTGWIRTRNLTRKQRANGITKDVPSNSIVTPDPEYCMGTKIYGVGIKQDPVSGSKFGKGIQHLTSAYWVSHLAEFIAANFSAIQEFLSHAARGSEKYPSYDFIYLTNMSNHLFNRADVIGLQTQEAKDYFMMATWLIMAAAEVDDFPFGKYTKEERKSHRQQFYKTYLNPHPGPGVVDVGRDDATKLGKFAAPLCRVDLIPMIAMDRLGINNELSALKYPDAEQPLREGFMISKRTDSLKRHFEAVHRGERDEDHIIHLVWNFMAIWHVLHIYPNKNDLINFENIRHVSTETKKADAYQPTTSLMKIVQRKLEPSQVLKLDWNEGAIPPPASVRKALLDFVVLADGHYLKWYPKLGGGEELRKKLAEYCKVIPENIIITNGSDDALILICQTFLGPGKIVIAPVPTYEHFCCNAVSSGANLVRFSPKNVLHTDENEIGAAIEQYHSTIVYLVSPNNPMGTQWTSNSIRRLATRYKQCIFLIDEAYYEFGQVDPTTNQLITCTKLVEEFENVIVTRTFSKAFCLASLRCGYLIAHPNIIESLKVRYNPKSVNSMAQVAAYHALMEFNSYYQPYIYVTNEARKHFAADLTAKGFTVKSGGGGNFICVEVPGGRVTEMIAKLEEKGIYVRDISLRVPGTIRISIGEDMNRVRDVMIAVVEELGYFVSKY